MLRKAFLDHPETVGETYGEHLVQAWSFAGAMFVGSLACLVHGLVPGLCTRTGSRVIGDLHDRMIVNRARHTHAGAARRALGQQS